MFGGIIYKLERQRCLSLAPCQFSIWKEVSVLALDVCVALIGEPEKGDVVLIGLEDGRTLSLTYGTTIKSNAWQVLSPDDLAEVVAVFKREKDNPAFIVGDLTCTVDLVSFETTIAVGKVLHIWVTSTMPWAEGRNVRMMLGSPVKTITVV